MPIGNNKITVSVTLPKELIERIDVEAKKLYISRSAYIVTALAQKMQSEEIMKTLPDFVTALRSALQNEQAKSKITDFNIPDTDMPYMDATREGAEKLDFMQRLNEDIAKEKR